MIPTPKAIVSLVECIDCHRFGAVAVAVLVSPALMPWVLIYSPWR